MRSSRRRRRCTATRPSQNTFVHEIAHQWFGNSVTPVEWVDIWLNEGFATWSQWIWTERNGGPRPSSSSTTNYAPRRPTTYAAFWFPASGQARQRRRDLRRPIYTRGAMTLQALRQKIGDDVFFEILRRWYAENKYGNVTTADFIALSEDMSGRQLDQFFQVWLYDPGKPASW